MISSLKKTLGGMINYLAKNKVKARAIFIFTGIVSTVWFLARVIPKPSRATYPCMRAAAPVMSGFVIYLLSLGGSVMAFRLAREKFVQARYIAFAMLLASSAILAVVFFKNDSRPTYATYPDAPTLADGPNQPVGTAKGINPGRVVWVWDKDATNENLDMTTTAGIQWFTDANTNQTVVDTMVKSMVLNLTSAQTEAAAWDSLFIAQNVKKGLGKVGYSTGQKIFVKLNMGSCGWTSDKYMARRTTYNYGISETSPQMMFAILKQLVNVAGIPQENIYIGDPIAHIWKDAYDKCVAVFPNVKYIDNFVYGSKDATTLNNTRTKINTTTDSVIVYSDKGKVMTGAKKDKLYKEMYEANYLINLATLKGHERGGITLGSKNHFGSHTRSAASHLHPGLIWVQEWGGQMRDSYGNYRVLVDLMGHEKIGGNTMLFIVEGLYGGPEANLKPTKWKMHPFNNDWPNSLFASLDPVALESVCYDFLRTEFTQLNHPNAEQGKSIWFPQYGALDDYLHQAASPANWPAKIKDRYNAEYSFAGYDPEGNGSLIGSLGVHEHWNNATDKKYSRNLNSGNGIELTNITIKSELPYFNGDTTDEFWSNASWVAINQTWLPYGQVVPASDFKGRYKLKWSAKTNRLCMLAEITDDVFVGGYTEGNDGYWNYDILEIFIDEDNSGGLHDNESSGKNAENAFAYHVAVNAPADGQVTNSKTAIDLAGTSTRKNYASHFPDFAMKKTGNTYTYELSLNMYIDTYNDANPTASLVTPVLEGKKIGLSVAYCDNDNASENPLVRDNFFGSVWVSSANQNRSYIDASIFGKYVLTSAGNVAQQLTQPAAVKLKNLDQTTAISDLSTLRFSTDTVYTANSYTVSANSANLKATISGKSLVLEPQNIFTGDIKVCITASGGKIPSVAYLSVTMNQPPKLKRANFTEFMVASIGGEIALTDNLDTVYTDPDNDAMTYSIAKQSPSINASITGIKLAVKLAEGYNNEKIYLQVSDGYFTTTDSFSVVLATAIRLVDASKEVNIYPNPVSGTVLYITLSGKYMGNLNFRISTINGQICNQGKLMGMNNNKIINVAGLSNGSYILELYNEKYKAVKKLNIYR